PRVVVERGYSVTPRIAGDRLLFAHDTFRNPAELFTVLPGGGELRAITHLNDARGAAIAWGEGQPPEFRGADRDHAHGSVIKPASGNGKVPVALLIHGGPQGTFDDHFHYRWNAEAFAGHGFGVVIVDFHGSTGYGQAFTDAVNRDWGGAPY